jgi:hypothetical protein
MDPNDIRYLNCNEMDSDDTRYLSCNELEAVMAQQSPATNFPNISSHVEEVQKILDNLLSLFEEVRIKKSTSFSCGGRAYYMYHNTVIGIFYGSKDFKIDYKSVKTNLQTAFYKYNESLNVVCPIILYFQIVNKNQTELSIQTNITGESLEIPKKESLYRDLNEIWTPTILGI